MNEDVVIWTEDLFDQSSDLSAGSACDSEEVDNPDRLVNVASRQPYFGWHKGNQP